MPRMFSEGAKVIYTASKIMGAFLYKQAVVFLLILMLLTMYLVFDYSQTLVNAQFLMIVLTPFEVIALIVGLRLRTRRNASIQTPLLKEPIFTHRNTAYSLIALLLGCAPFGVLWLMYKLANSSRGHESGDWGFLTIVPFLDAFLVLAALVIAVATVCSITVYFAFRALHK